MPEPADPTLPAVPPSVEIPVDPVDLDQPNGNGHGDPGSVLSGIRARRAELAERTSIDLLLPGYQGLLAVRYRPVPDEEFDKLVAKLTAAGNAATNIDQACDLLIRACECVLILEDEHLEPLRGAAGQPLGFTTELAQTLDYYTEGMTGRAVVRGLFSPDGTAPLAPALHANAVLSWLQGSEHEIDKSLLGE